MVHKIGVLGASFTMMVLEVADEVPVTTISRNHLPKDRKLEGSYGISQLIGSVIIFLLWVSGFSNTCPIPVLSIINCRCRRRSDGYMRRISTSKGTLLLLEQFLPEGQYELLGNCMITDQHQRVHDYLRLSLTDSCNFRCTYCMPEENISCMPSTHLMQPDEIAEIAKTFVDLGVKKIRLTGGEPLVRKEALQIIEQLGKLPVELSITTNGVLVDRFLSVFKKAGIRSLNLSIDTLQREKFKKITRRDSLDKVWENILLLIEAGIHVKLNVVLMKGVNDEEVMYFIQLTRDLPLHVRFIEFMPFDGNRWENENVITARQVLERVVQEVSFIKLKDEKHATAKKFKLLDAVGTFAFITTMSEPFCGDCNRMRLTADGKMKNCLFSRDEADILGTLRRGEDIISVIKMCMWNKHAKMGGQFHETYDKTKGASIDNRSMIKIGG